MMSHWDISSYCPPGISVTTVFVENSFSECFLSTLAPSVLALYIVIFGGFDLLISGCASWKHRQRGAGQFITRGHHYAPIGDDPQPGRSGCCPKSQPTRAGAPILRTTQSLLMVFIAFLPYLQAITLVALLNVNVYGFILVRALGLSVVWIAGLAWFTASDGFKGTSWGYLRASFRQRDQVSPRAGGDPDEPPVDPLQYRPYLIMGFWVTASVLAVLEVIDMGMKAAAGDFTGKPLLVIATFQLSAIVIILCLAISPFAIKCFSKSLCFRGPYTRILTDDAGDVCKDILSPDTTPAHVDQLCDMFLNHPRQSDRKTKISIGKKYRNRPKNRYCNRLPYDDTRVILRNPVTASRHGGDYINASPILLPTALSQVVGGRAATYIATQGPLPCTVEDFWRMITELDTHVIVMLSDLQEGAIVKCEKYWPDANAPLYLPAHNLVVTQTGLMRTLRSSGSSKDVAYVKRSFRLQNALTGEARPVVQFQYAGWSQMDGVAHEEILKREYFDFSMSEGSSAVSTNWNKNDDDDDDNNNNNCEDAAARSDYLDFLADTERTQGSFGSDAGPIVIHCSAGTGRTGVHILAAECVRQHQRGLGVRPLALLQDMRRQRLGMIHTQDQFRPQGGRRHQNIYNHYEKILFCGERPSVDDMPLELI